MLLEVFCWMHAKDVVLELNICVDCREWIYVAAGKHLIKIIKASSFPHVNSSMGMPH